ncbi:MAG: hypothetical protein ACO2O6_08615 [Candidatus Hydrothermia bacterium]|jgi:hypothetical protein
MRDLFKFWGSKFKELEKLEELKDEIKHFESIQVSIEEVKISDLKRKIEIMKDYPKKSEELDDLYGKISREELSVK